MESELFGHERGAFTDARTQKRGLLEQADDGTVFLDEIGEMTPALQAKLLRFLEEKAFRRVGGSADIHVDVRVIAATNRNLEETVRDGKFRDDLYYRLNVLRLEVPPLRARVDDVSRLAQHFVEIFSREFRRPVRALSRGGRAGAPALRLAGQRARAAQPRRARGAPQRRRGAARRLTSTRCRASAEPDRVTRRFSCRPKASTSRMRRRAWSCRRSNAPAATRRARRPCSGCTATRSATALRNSDCQRSRRKPDRREKIRERNGVGVRAPRVQPRQRSPPIKQKNASGTEWASGPTECSKLGGSVPAKECERNGMGVRAPRSAASSAVGSPPIKGAPGNPRSPGARHHVVGLLRPRPNAPSPYPAHGNSANGAAHGGPGITRDSM